jgi:uncharacterized membrane protein/glutaredoxin
MRFRLASLLTLSLFALALIVTPASARTEPPVVRAVMFWMNGCPHCEDVIENVLPPLHEKYGSQFDLLMIEVSDTRNIDTLFYVAASYNIPKEQTGVPFLIIGDHVLVGSTEVREQLPALIDDYLAQGGVNWPENPQLASFIPTDSPASSQTSNLPAATESPLVDPIIVTVPTMRDNGFTLAVVIMIGMVIALLYSIISFAVGKTFILPAWTEWFIPTLILIGIGVAGYLSYVETQSVSAVCGPIGDCNTVQTSPYATLFGFLPVGILGLLGYFGLLTAWLARKYIPRFEKSAAIGYFGMAFFAVIFSLYLTYLEPFVIKAVCIWCLTSAVIVTLLLLLGTPPVVRQFSISDEDE